MLNRYWLTVIIVIVLVTIIVGGYWYFTVYRPKELLMAFYRDSSEAHQFHHAGRYDESITAFQKVIMKAPTKNDETYIKYLIAYDLFKRNRGDDRTRAVAMYKEIMNDPLVSSLGRAVAIYEFMDTYNGTHDAKFARKDIFKGEPLGKFLDEAGLLGYQSSNDSDVEYAVRKSYELAETFYPFSISEFRIANWYKMALDDVWYKNETEKQAFLSQLKEWTKKGESNLPKAERFHSHKSRVGYVYLMNALARVALAKYTNRDYSYAESLFKVALQKLSPEDILGHSSFNINAYNISLYIRFEHAAALVDIYGEKRKGEIITLLQPIISPSPTLKGYPSPTFYEFLRNEMGESHSTHGHKKDILQLINIAPGLKEAFVARGIKY